MQRGKCLTLRAGSISTNNCLNFWGVKLEGGFGEGDALIPATTLKLRLGLYKCRFQEWKFCWGNLRKPGCIS